MQNININGNDSLIKTILFCVDFFYLNTHMKSD